MKATWISLAAAAALAATALYAKVPADAPAGTTGLCKDGTYTDSATKAGACSGHKGVKTWYGAADTKAKKEAKSEKAAAKETKAEKAAAAKEAKAEKAAAAKEAKAEKAAAKKSASKATETSAAPAPAKPAAAPAPMPEKSAARPSAAAKSVAAGGGAGKVWLNTDSKVYHCEKDALYGKTKQGEYMTEAQAKAAGGRPSRGKECS